MKGLTLDSFRKYDEATECFDKALELYPDHYYAWFDKGYALSKLGKHKDSKKCYNKAKELGYGG